MPSNLTTAPCWVGALLGLALGAAARAEPLAVRLAYLGAQEDSARFGAEQGLSEANLQGQFLGQTYRMDVNPAAPASGTYTAIIAAIDGEKLLELSARWPGVPVFNVGSDSDAVRGDCRENLLHVLPSASMLAAAEAQWRTQQPQSQARASAWHHTMTKYAAAQLNKRYARAHARQMDDRAWAGWAAVKMVSDTIARQQRADPAALLTFLRNDLAFDGQKGSEMSFRSSGQLRQPLLLVEADAIVAEAPVRGVAEPDDLDSLGSPECAK